jgi:hypothetical protein
VPLAQVRDLLGHASITTTERYDNQRFENLQAAAAKLESGKTFTPVGGAADGRGPFCQVFVKNGPDGDVSEGSAGAHGSEPKRLKEKNLEGWYRYGDSNPGPVAENHVS